MNKKSRHLRSRGAILLVILYLLLFPLFSQASGWTGVKIVNASPIDISCGNTLELDVEISYFRDEDDNDKYSDKLFLYQYNKNWFDDQMFKLDVSMPAAKGNGKFVVKVTIKCDTQNPNGKCDFSSGGMNMEKGSGQSPHQIYAYINGFESPKVTVNCKKSTGALAYVMPKDEPIHQGGIAVIALAVASPWIAVNNIDLLITHTVPRASAACEIDNIFRAKCKTVSIDSSRRGRIRIMAQLLKPQLIAGQITIAFIRLKTGYQTPFGRYMIEVDTSSRFLDANSKMIDAHLGAQVIAVVPNDTKPPLINNGQLVTCSGSVRGKAGAISDDYMSLAGFVNIALFENETIGIGAAQTNPDGSFLIDGLKIREGANLKLVATDLAGNSAVYKYKATLSNGSPGDCNQMISYTGRTGKTISGQVIADEGYKKTEFNTPNGNLIVYTTADQEQLQTGKTLTGTVIAEPSGKTQKEKDDNLQELRKAVLMVGETTVAITGLEQAIQYTGKKNAENQFNVSLSDPSGTNRQTLGWTIPKEPVKTYSDPAQPLPTMFINENLVLGNDVITVHTIPRTDAEFRESDQFTLADEKGRSFPVHPLAQSPSTTVIRIPAEAAKGNIRIIRSRDGQATDRVNFNYADLELSSPNTNLKSGERSFVMTNVVVHGEEKPGHPLPRFRVTLTNLNPEIVSMEGGDVQYVSFPGNDNTWMAKRMIEGKVVGRFSVNATLVSDLNNTNDPFRAQKEVLNDPESFNRWIAALKSDLRNYALAQANDPRGQNIRANAIRAMENLPDCNSLASLNECKMMADELLQPLQVPKGAATCWQCSYEAMKAATGQLQEKISGKATVVNWPLIQCGLEIMRKTGDELNDDQLEDSAEAITDQLPDSLSLNFSLSFEDKVFEFLMIIIRHMDSAIKQQQKKMNDLQKDSSHVFKYSPHELLLATELMNRSGNDNMVTPYMVGYLDPFRKILWTTPREKQRILGELGAQKLPNGKYKISALNFNGKTISYPVDVMMDNPEKILLLADEKDEGIPLDIDKTRKEDAKGKKEEGKPIDIDEKKPGSTDPLTDTKKKEDEGIPFDVKKKEDDEGIPLDIIFTPKYGGEFKDSTGTVYRFWRRSKCTLVDKGSKERSPCEPDGYSVFDLKTNKYKIIPDGHYCQFENYDWYRCKGGKETDVCTERLIVTSLKYIYANKNCTTLIDVVPEMDWACQ